MKDLYNLHNFYNVETNGKSSKQLNNRGKSFGYQVLGFGSGVAAEVVIDPNQRGIFGFGVHDSSHGETNLVSTSGVVASDTSAVGSTRYGQAGASYGIDKGIFAYGFGGGSVNSLSNLVNNLGVVAADVTGVGTARTTLGAATYGGDKALFGYGIIAPNDKSMTNLVTNVGVVGSDVSGVGTARNAPAATTYGSNRQTAMFAFGNIGSGTYTSIKNLVTNVGVVGDDVSGVGTARHGLAAAAYGGDKAIFGYGTAGYNISLTNLVSSVGVVSSDVTGVGTARHWTAATVYGGDKAVFAFGTTIGSTAVSNKVSNVGVVATDTGAVGTARSMVSGLGYSV